MERDTALAIVIASLKDTIEQFGTEHAGEVNADTVIVGQGAALDSIGVVSLVVDIEQRLETDHDISVTLASEKAMSQRSSPFRTCAVLADHICATILEGQSA
jgi:acyl carrier protein